MAVAECLVWHSWWVHICHLVLLVVVLLCLFLKRSSERPRRTTWDFYTDVSKQIFGSMFLHCSNVKFSDIVRHATRTGDNCDWYLVSISLDCTLGSFLMIAILKAVHNHIFLMIFKERMGKDKANFLRAEWIQEGDYKDSGIECNRLRRTKQIVFWVFGPVFSARVLVVVVMYFCGGKLAALFHSMLGGLELHARELVTIAIVPMPFNIFQFFYLDARIKRPRELPPSTSPLPSPSMPVPSPLPPPSLSEPLLRVDPREEVFFPGCDVPLSLDCPERQASERSLRTFFGDDEVRRFYGLERYNADDITGLIDKMMGGAVEISEHTAGFYLAHQLANARTFAICNKAGGIHISEQDFSNLLLRAAVVDSADLLVPPAIRDRLLARAPPTRTYEVVSHTSVALWRSHIPQEQVLRLPDWLWRFEVASPGDRLDLGLLVRPSGGKTVVGVIVDKGKPNYGAWMAMWNSAEEWVKPVEAEVARAFSRHEREELDKQAVAVYRAVTQEFEKLRAHANQLGTPRVNSRAFLTYFQQFMPAPSTA